MDRLIGNDRVAPLAALSLTFATLLSVPASVTIVGWTTLWTARLYSGIIRFPLAVVAAETPDAADAALLLLFELTELDRFTRVAVPEAAAADMVVLSTVGVFSGSSSSLSYDCR
jgi:hypothetical protein